MNTYTKVKTAKRLSFNYLIYIGFLTSILFSYSFTRAAEYKSVKIQHASGQNKIELNIVNLLADRLKEAGVVDVQTTEENHAPLPSKETLLILKKNKVSRKT